jgi:hypothetical protein
MSDEEREEWSFAGSLPGEAGHAFPIYRREDGETMVRPCSNCGKTVPELLEGPTGMTPCEREWRVRADKAWEEAKLERITTYMGHSGIQITLDLYGHMLPGNEAEAAGRLDAYLSRATGTEHG